MKRAFKSRTFISALIAALLCSVTSVFGVGAPTLAGNDTLPALIYSEASTPILTDDKPYIPPDLLKNEAESMQRFASALVEYQNQFDAVTGAARPDVKQIAAVEAKLSDLKRRFPEFQSNARAVVTKLKNANKWTDELDAYFEAAAKRKNAPAEFINFVKNKGGCRKVLDKSISSLHLVLTQFEADEAAVKEIRNRKVSLLNWAESFVVPSASAAGKDINPHCTICDAHVLNAMFCALFGCLGFTAQYIYNCLHYCANLV